MLKSYFNYLLLLLLFIVYYYSFLFIKLLLIYLLIIIMNKHSKTMSKYKNWKKNLKFDFKCEH